MIRKLLFLISAFTLGVLFGTIVVNCYEYVTLQPWKWKDPPIILNCYGEELNEAYIQQGVDYWKKFGYEFAFIEQNPSKKTCSKEEIDGFVILKKRITDKGSGTLAVTRRKIGFGYIRNAVIYFNPGSYRINLIIEHELGHALGFQHVNIKGHIMYPTINGFGPKFWIPD